MLRSTAGLILLSLILVHPLDAQRRKAPASVDALQVRTELAGVLLQSRRYDEAAREYRAILERQPSSFAVRLGLARALAWGERHREAETELRILRGQRPGDRTVASLLRSVRESIEPRSKEAAVWFAEEPGYVPYRRALARALMREGKALEAIPHYESLLQRTAADTAARYGLATALADVRQYDAALAQYDTLVNCEPRWDWLLGRAYVNVARRDLPAAEADAVASLHAKRNTDAYLLLGDLHRWRGNYDEALRTYGFARMTAPARPAVHAAFAQLQRDVRPIPAFMPSGHGAGWHVRSNTMSDNLGVTYMTAGARREVDLAFGFTGSVDVEFRQLREQADSFSAHVTGFAFMGGLGHEFTHGPWLTRLHGSGGIVKHESATLLTGVVNASVWHGAWGVSLGYAKRPAYPQLLTALAIASPEMGGSPVTETSMTAAIGGPLRHVDIALSAQRAALSDGNVRSVGQAVLRYPFTRNLAALGTATGMWFNERSALYWDPASYLAAAAGLEVSTRKPLGISIAARAFAGPARSVEEEVKTSLQLGGGVDLNHRTLTRDVGFAISYGSGRGGDYRRLEVSAYATLLR